MSAERPLLKVLGPQRSGLLALADGVREFYKLPHVIEKYADEGVKIPIVTSTGFRQREQQTNQDPEGANRVAFMPGWGLKSRTHGALEEPKRSTSNPRTLFTWPRKFTVSIWSADTSPGAAADEEKQIAASDTMLETVIQAMYYVIQGAVRPGGDLYQDEFSANRTFGIELLAPFVLLQPVFDLPVDRITEAKPIIEKVTTP